jgi:xanthine dehydrogenase YagT iron-sulfur-binding subunit
MPNDKRKKKEKETSGEGKVSRRRFLATAGIGAVGVAAAAGQTGAKPATIDEATPVVGGADTVKVSLRINGRTHRLLVEPRWSLLYVLREKLGLTGTKVGCERGECGACTVLIDGKSRYACLTLALEAEGTETTTLEGLLDGEDLGDVQRAFLEHDAFQCGYCTPGQIVAVEGLLRANADPSLDEIRVGVSGNLCRCGAYPHIFQAATRSAELKRKRGGGR